MINRKSRSAEFVSNFGRKKKKNTGNNKKRKTNSINRKIKTKKSKPDLSFEDWNKKCVTKLQELHINIFIINNVEKASSYEQIDKAMYDIPYVFMLNNGLVRKKKFVEDWRIQKSVRSIKK